MVSSFAERAPRRLALVLLAATLLAPPPSEAAEAPAKAKAEADAALMAAKATAKAEGALMAAAVVARAGDPAKVEPLVQKALEAAPDDVSIGKRGAQILADAEKLRRQQALARGQALLAEARRLAADGNVKDARELLRGKLDSLDPDLLAIADQTLAATHRGWLADRFFALRDGWLFDALLGFVLLALIAAVLWLLRRWIAWKKRASWLIGGVEDTTGTGVGMMASEHLTRWSGEPVAGSAGLLRMDGLSVQSTPRFERQLEIVLSAALAELPNFGQVNLGALAKAYEALRSQAMRLRPSITISASTLDQQIIVQLTRKARDGRIRLTASAGPKTVEGAVAAAASASFKMYYLLAANDASLPQAEAADKLRIGLEQLRRYAGGRDPAALELANETISSVLAESPGFDEARLYLGVVLDLQERHDEAEGAFRFLRDHGEADVRTRATYNLAVSNFRKYKPGAVSEAIDILDELIGSEIEDDLAPGSAWFARLAESPIRAMAVAARANAVAHKPIWWQTFFFGDMVKEPPRKVLRRKRAARERVLAWVDGVDRIADALGRLGTHDLDERHGWDALTKRQLLWSTHNARGNVRLNLAANFWREPAVPGQEDEEKRYRATFLDEAHRHFQTCEMLLPPGVETLTNLETTLLFLSRLDDARRYAEEAIALNPDYEYAYYRLAETWDADHNEDMVRKTFLRFEAREKPFRIPEFKELAARHHIPVTVG
jgi:tetratricopeptide (TPR) repeat protein